MIGLVRFLTLGALAAVLAGCAERELILPGEREDVRASLPGGAEQVLRAEATPAALSPQVNLGAWGHQAGAADHNPGHAAFTTAPTLAWSVDIGSGDGKRYRISASPVSDGARIYTIDSRATLTAVTSSGQVAWSADLTPAGDRADSASGGGLAVAGGVVYATTGFGTLEALNAETGARLWTHNFRSVAGPPTVAGNLVYVVTRNGLGWALRRDTGRVAWSIPGLATDVGIIGGPSPAVSGDFLVFPFASGDLATYEAATGTPRWRAVIAGRRIEPVAARISDMTGDPVIAGGLVVAGTHGGRTAAFDVTTGEEIWRVSEGAMSAAVVTGNAVYQVTDRNALIRLDRATGALVWSQPLPLFRSNRPRRFDAVFAHFGPILAGGRLVVASDDDRLRFFDPTSGALTGEVGLPAGAASDPIVVNGTLYVVTEAGRLVAFR